MTLEWSWQRPHHCRPCGGCRRCGGSVTALLWSSLSLSQHTGAHHRSETCTLFPRHPHIPLSAHVPPGAVSCRHRRARAGGPGQAALCLHGCAASAQWAQPVLSGLSPCPVGSASSHFWHGLAAEREAVLALLGP